MEEQVEFFHQDIKTMEKRDGGIPTWWQAIVGAVKERLLAVATSEKHKTQFMD